MEQVKLLSTTVFLTALIWASADSLVNETITVDIALEPVPAAGASGMMIEATPAGQRFELQVSGPRRIIEGIQAQAPLNVRLRVPDLPRGATDLQLERGMLKQQLAEQWGEFSRLTIASIQPDTLPVTIDHWVSPEVEIVLGRSSLGYAVEPQLERTSVSVRMRESRFAEMESDGRLQLDISSDVDRVLKDQAPGQSVTVPVALDAGVFGPGARLTPGAVSVTATLKEHRATAQIPTVPVLIAVSFANLQRAVRPVSPNESPLDLVTRTITVSGSSEAVDRLVQGTTRAYAIVQLKQADLDSLDTLITLTPEFHLPPGITLVSEPAPIELKLTLAAEPE